MLHLRIRNLDSRNSESLRSGGILLVATESPTIKLTSNVEQSSRPAANNERCSTSDGIFQKWRPCPRFQHENTILICAVWLNIDRWRACLRNGTARLTLCVCCWHLGTTANRVQLDRKRFVRSLSRRSNSIEFVVEMRSWLDCRFINVYQRNGILFHLVKGLRSVSDISCYQD